MEEMKHITKKLKYFHKYSRTSPHFPENRIIFWIGHILEMYFQVHNSTQPFRSRKIPLGMTSNRKSKSRFVLRIIACSSFTIRRLSLEPAESTDLSPRSYTEPRHPTCQTLGPGRGRSKLSLEENHPELRSTGVPQIRIKQ